MTPQAARRGVTLIEMMVVVAIVAVMAAISVPSVTSGIETLRLKTASDDIITLLNSGLNRAERLQTAMEIEIGKTARTISLRSADAAYQRKLTLPEGVTIEHVFPETGEEDPAVPRTFLLLPGGAIPRIGLELRNAKGRHSILRIDPITGTAQVEEAQE